MIYTELRLPYPNPKVVMILPSPKFKDTRASESKVTIKRTMLGDTWSYVDSSDRTTLKIPLQLTRAKSIELERVLDVYKAAPMRIDLYDGSQWKGQLVGEPVTRTTTGRTGETAYSGGEVVEVTLTFSAIRLN